MSESEPVCLRVITEGADSQIVDEIDEPEILEAIHKSYIAEGITRNKQQICLQLGCEVIGCHATCFMVYDDASGEMLFGNEAEGITIDPVTEEDCFLIQSQRRT